MDVPTLITYLANPPDRMNAFWKSYKENTQNLIKAPPLRVLPLPRQHPFACLPDLVVIDGLIAVLPTEAVSKRVSYSINQSAFQRTPEWTQPVVFKVRKCHLIIGNTEF